MTSMRELFLIPPPRSTKNFIALNVRNVNKKPEKTTGQAQRSTSQARTSSKETNGPIPRVPSGKLGNQRANIKSEKSKPKTYRHAGCQTLNLDLDESLLEEGVIRYPSSKWKERSTHDHQFKSIALQTELKPETNGTCSNTELIIPTKHIDNILGHNAAACENNENQDINNIHPFHDNEEPISPALSVVTVIEKPKKIPTQNPVVVKNTNIICKSTNSLNNDIRKNNNSTINVSKVPGKHKRGTVPRYIIEKKLEKEREERRLMEEAERTGILDPDCPPGHILLPTEKRMEQLEFLKKNYKNLINEMNRIPVRNDSLKIRQHRVMIEKELDKLEEAIRLFSKEKLFVKP